MTANDRQLGPHGGRRRQARRSREVTACAGSGPSAWTRSWLLPAVSGSRLHRNQTRSGLTNINLAETRPRSPATNNGGQSLRTTPSEKFLLAEWCDGTTAVGGAGACRGRRGGGGGGGQDRGGVPRGEGGGGERGRRDGRTEGGPPR